MIYPRKAKYLLRRLGQEPTPEANGDGVGSRPSLELCEQVTNVALDRLLGEVEAVADLSVRESLGDELKNFDLARGREVLRLRSVGAGRELEYVWSYAAPRRDRLEPAGMLAIPGQDFLALGSVHFADIGGPSRLL